MSRVLAAFSVASPHCKAIYQRLSTNLFQYYCQQLYLPSKQFLSKCAHKHCCLCKQLQQLYNMNLGMIKRNYKYRYCCLCLQVPIVVTYQQLHKQILYKYCRKSRIEMWFCSNSSRQPHHSLLRASLPQYSKQKQKRQETNTFVLPRPQGSVLPIV